MKKLNMKIWAGAMAIILLASSCDDFLDINKNPNQPLDATPQLILPSAIVSTAAMSSQYNSMGLHFGGFIANAGGFSGFGTLFTYNLTAGDYNGLWVNTYQDPLKDLQTVIDKTEGDSTFGYYNATAKILKAYNYQKLVDTFGDVPYTEALQGEAGNFTPVYDDAETIYNTLISLLDEAVVMIDSVQTKQHDGRLFPIDLTANSDPLFENLTGNVAIDTQMANWKRFAKSLKLKMLVRMGDYTDTRFDDPRFNPNWVNPGKATRHATYTFLDGIGFITDDAIVDPGYETNRPNPAWNSWGTTTTGTLSNTSRVPTKYAYGFYANQFDNGQVNNLSVGTLSAKLIDAGRGRTMYQAFNAVPGQTSTLPTLPTTTPTNQLGNEVNNPAIIAGTVTFAGSGTWAGLGALKGAAMGQPLMLLAELRFLVAEAILNGELAGHPTYPDLTTAFNLGINASFTYLYKDQGETVSSAGGTIASMVTTYQTDNNSANNPSRSYLVNIGDATTPAQRLEAIITQKYIALNMIHSDEAYNEFRRTGYPVTVKNGAPHLDIASNKSTIIISETESTLPTRVMYPSSEQSFNSANYRNINYRGVDKIFWDTNATD